LWSTDTLLQGARATHIREPTPRRAIGRIREWRLIKPPVQQNGRGHRSRECARDVIAASYSLKILPISFLRNGVQRNARDAMSRNTA
jgi:hypothetical protein